MMRTEIFLWKSMMIVEMVQQVCTMGQGYTNTYLIPICNYLELAPKCIGPIEDNQAMVDSTTSDKELSKDHAEGLGGEILYRNPHLTFYITGKLVIGHLKGHNSKVHIVRSPTSMCDRNFQISISRLGQTRHLWVRNRGREGFVVRKGVVGDMETIITGRTVRT